MDRTEYLYRSSTEWPRESPLASCADAYTRHLAKGRYACHTESATTTHRYVEADLAMKEKALAKLNEPDTMMHRYRPPDALMQFFQAL